MSCISVSTHSVTTGGGQGTKTYEWTVEGGDAYIKSGQGTDAVEVESSGDSFTAITVTCLVTDDTGNSILSESTIHERTSTGEVHSDTFYIMNKPMVNTNATLDFIITDPVDDGVFKLSGGSDWTPSASEYPEDGTILLEGGNYLEVPHEFPSDEAWQFVRCYDVDGRNFNIIVISYHGDNTASLLYGNQDNLPILEDANTRLPYTPPVGNYKIDETLNLPTVDIVYEMDSTFSYDVVYEMNSTEA